MKNVNFFILVIALMAMNSCGEKTGSGSKQGSQGTDTAGQTVANLESKWVEAECRRDTAVLAGLTADDFTFVLSDGRLVNKLQYLESIADDTTTCVSSANTEYLPRVYGNTVVITGLATFNTKLENGTEQVRYQWTDTWIKGADGQWKCVAAQSVKLPEN